MFQEEPERDSLGELRTEGIARVIARVIAGQNVRRIVRVIAVLIIKGIARQNVMQVATMTVQNLTQNPILKKQANLRGKGSDPPHPLTGGEVK
jgi:hypothetical protein